MKKQIKKLTSIMFAVSLILCIIGCKKEPEFNILDYVYTVSFESNGGTEIDSQTVVLGETVKEPEAPEHTENSETEKFAGWYTDKELTKEYVFSTKVESSFTLYAKWRHEHKGVGEWKNYDDEHFKLCDCGTAQNSGKCSFIDKEIIKPATCTQEGKKTVYCTVCKYEKEETIPVIEHTLGETTIEPTCTQEGKKTIYCTVCEYEKEETIPVKEHTLGIWKITDEPTETERGQMQRVCKVCGEPETKEIQPVPEGFRFVIGGTVTGAKNSNNYAGVFIEGRTVTLSDFYMGKYEVTQEEYASVMTGQKVTVDGVEYTLESNPSYCTKDSEEYTLFNGDVQEKRPVEGVTWYDSVWYCNALSQKEGLTPAYNIEVTQVKQASGKTGYYIYKAKVTLNKNATGYRLPTEAEWEYAARGGDQTAADWNYVFSGVDTAEGVSYRSSKNSGLDSVGWYCYNNITGTTGDSDVTENVSGKGTHQVGKKDHNRLGLYDMSGNVWEWCYDCYGTITTTTPADGATSGNTRVIRGGSWVGYAEAASVSNRYLSYGASNRDDVLGFRVVRQAN